MTKQILLVVCVSVLLAAPQSLKAQYLSVAADVPLAAGLRELPDAVLVFDKPQGRIVQITARADTQFSPTAIQQFYRTSLPNLGWREKPGKTSGNGLTFTRKSEILRLTFSADLVIFDLAPQALSRP